MKSNRMALSYRKWLHSFWIFVYVLFLSVNVDGSANTLHHGKCFGGEQFMILSSSFDGCIDACIAASQCKALVYDRRAPLCKIYDQIGTTSNCPGNIIVMKDDISKNAMDICGINGCPITDCGPIPTVPGEAVVQGNQVSLNSVVKYTCTHNGEVTYVKCQSNGQWSNLPDCRNLECGLPTYNLANGQYTLDGTTQIGDTATYTCNTGFRLDPPSIGIQVACNANVLWETPNSTCVVVMNGQDCLTDYSCLDTTAICIWQTSYLWQTSSNTYGKCFCKPDATYNDSLQVCIEACVISDSFVDAQIVPDSAIMWYDIGRYTYKQTELECWDDCVISKGGLSADYNIDERCYCNNVTYQQIIGSNPSAVFSGVVAWKIMSKRCF